MPSYQYRKSHCGDKTILRPSYLHNGISYTGKMASLYWIGPWWMPHRLSFRASWIFLQIFAVTVSVILFFQVFREHRIDGATLPHLSEGHLINFVKMKLGPAIRLRLAIQRLWTHVISKLGHQPLSGTKDSKCSNLCDGVSFHTILETYWWLSARKTQLHCVSNEVSSFLY